MKCQDFSSDENFISSEDMIFIFHMWRYHGCHMATAVSANRKRASQHHFNEIYMPYCYNVQNTYKRYLFSVSFDQNLNVCKILSFIQWIKDKFKKSLCCHFIGVSTINGKLHGRLEIWHYFIFSCWKIFHEWAQRKRRIDVVSPCHHVISPMLLILFFLLCPWLHHWRQTRFLYSQLEFCRSWTNQ